MVAWLFVLAHESRRVAQAETRRQTALLEAEIEAHKVTDAKLQAAKETAEAANLAKSRYVVGISHELRTPLSAVLGYAQLLEGDAAIPPARQNGIRVIRRSAQHLSGLIDGLLDISRMEAGRLQIHRDEIRIAEVLDQIVDMVRLQAQSAGLDFRFTRPEILPAVVATDEKRLRQVLLNLLSNAIKFTQAGHVALDLSYRSQVAVFTIRDTGPGIPEADLQRIFEPFERGATPAAAGTPGTGLGLTIANLLAQVMGGEISVTSELGRGTTFRFRLMLSAITRAAPIPVPPAMPARAYAGARRTVLVADDDAGHRALMREILEPEGFVVVEAADGPACLAAAEAERPDLLLLDIAMPGLSGWAVAKRLREAGFSGRIAMMSANVHEISPIRGDDAPARRDHRESPSTCGDFLARVTQLLGLEWAGAPEAEPVPTATPAEEASGPSPQQVGELLRLGRIGHIRGIEAKLAEMAQDATVPDAFVARLRGLVADFDMRRYLSVLQAMADGMADRAAASEGAAADG